MSFDAHVALLREFLNRRQSIVEQIDSRILNRRGGRGRARRLLDAAVVEVLLVTCPALVVMAPGQGSV